MFTRTLWAGFRSAERAAAPALRSSSTLLGDAAADIKLRMLAVQFDHDPFESESANRHARSHFDCALVSLQPGCGCPLPRRP